MRACMCVRECVRMCVCACVRVCVRACVETQVAAYLCLSVGLQVLVLRGTGHIEIVVPGNVRRYLRLH